MHTPPHERVDGRGAGPVIDAHAHVYPARYLDILESIGVSADSTRIARGMRASDEDEEMAARLAMMDAAGVDTQVLSVTPQLPAGMGAEDARKACRMANDIYAGVIERYPGRFLAYGAIPFEHPDAALAEIAHCLDELGFSGIAINSLLADPQAAVTDGRYREIFAKLDRRGTVLYIHPTGQSAFCTPMVNSNLTWVNGAPEPSASTAPPARALRPVKSPRPLPGFTWRISRTVPRFLYRRFLQKDAATFP